MSSTLGDSLAADARNDARDVVTVNYHGSLPSPRAGRVPVPASRIALHAPVPDTVVE
jgi:hypothetical protein